MWVLNRSLYLVSQLTGREEEDVTPCWGEDSPSGRGTRGEAARGLDPLLLEGTVGRSSDQWEQPGCGSGVALHDITLIQQTSKFRITAFFESA